MSDAISRRTALRQMVAGTTALALAPAVFKSKAQAVPAESGRRSIKLALVGGAHIHAPGFANMMSDSPYVETKYVWDPSNDTAQRRQAVTGGEVVENLDTIWEDPEVDGVVICSQTVHHVDLGSHVMNLLLWFMEGDSPIDCTGCVDTVLNRYPGCDEYGEGMVRFESGAVATIAGGWVDRTNPNQIEVTGTQGHARVTRGELFLTIPEQGLTGAAPAGDLPANRAHPLELFFAAVGGVSDLPLISAREAALTNKVITGIYRAHEKRTWVDL